MLSKRQRRQSLSFAENVALLSSLRRAPTARHANPRPHSVAQEDSGRLLSFEREVSLTNTLAFLCGISDNPLHVVATCVEELGNRKGIRVLVAINKKHSTSASGTLMRIKNDLEQVFRHLSRASHVKDALLEGLVLGAIASMCKDRIFSRIKSRRRDATYTKRDKVFFGTVLQQTLDAVRKHSSHTGSGSEVETFARNSQNLLDCLEKLETCQERDVLRHINDVLRATHQLNKTTDFDRLFKGLSPTELDPQLQKTFIARLSKVAQYRECALYMIRIAKSLGLFKETEVKLVSLEPQLFATDLTTSPDCRLTGCLSRCDSDASPAFGVKNIASKLQKLDRNNSTFLSTVGGILSDARVHAEVQIVCYYELYPVARKPRVICSSKDACYLCNLFIQLHGTFHVPRTHGNLYTPWRLPPIPSLNHVQAQLNKALEAQIREVIGGLMSTETPRLTLIQNENESTVFPFSTSLPTPASSVVLAEASSRAVEAQQRLRELGNALTSGRVVETPPRSPTTGSCGSVSLNLEISTSSPRASRGSRAIAPELPSEEPLYGPGAHGAGSGTHHGPAKEMVDELTTAPLGCPAGANNNSTPEQLEAEEGGLEQESTPVPEPIPETGDAPIPKPEPDLKSAPQLKPEPEPEPDPSPRQPPNPALSPEPARVPPAERAFLPSSLPSPIPKYTHHSPHPLTRGHPITLCIHTTKPLPAFTTGLITLYPDFIRSLSRTSTPAPTPTPRQTTSRSVEDMQAHMQIEWLPRRHAAAFYLARPRGFVDLELSEEEGVDIDGGSAECVYIACRGEVVVVDVLRGVV